MKEIIVKAYYKEIIHPAVYDNKEPWNNMEEYHTTEKRYHVVNTTTGEILDDAQGFGYKTPQKAYAAYYYKHKPAEKKKSENIAREFLKVNNNIIKDLDNAMFQCLKLNEKLTLKKAETLLQKYNLPDNITPKLLFQIYKKL